MGHSNGSGLAGWVDMVLLEPHLEPQGVLDPANLLWKNIFVFTSAHGWPEPDGTPPTYTISDGAWLEMTTNNPESPAGPHPHPSPYAYPNNVGFPGPNYSYIATRGGAYRGLGSITGIELPLCWYLTNYTTQPIGLVKVAMPGSLFLRFDAGATATPIWGEADVPSPASYFDLSAGFYDWYNPSEDFDWAPGTGRLYSLWMQKAIAAKAADPTMSIEDMILWFGDNDSNRERERVQNWKDICRKFVKKLRSDLVANNLTNLPESQIRISWMGVLDFYDGIVAGTPQGNPDFLNAELQSLADDDPFIRFHDVNGYTTWAIDPGHLDSAGYLAAAKAVFDGILDMEVQPLAALDQEDLLTVAQIKERVRLYYTRGKSNTDASDSVLLLHINASMHHIIHQCDDMAWWLLHREELELDGGGVRSPITLPLKVHRVLKVESVGDTTFPLQHEMLGHTDGGRVQMVLRNATAGTYVVHYISLPRDLTKGTEKVPIPANLLEWLVVETCFRLAGASAQPLQIAHFQGKAQQQMHDVLLNLSATRRSTRDRIYTQRELPNVLRSRRGRSWDRN